MPRILLADDYPVVRRHVREILETEPGFSVCAEASNGLEAVTLERVDLVADEAGNHGALLLARRAIAA